MRLNQIINDLSKSQFFNDYVLNSKLLFIKQSFDHRFFEIDRLEEEIKKNDSKLVIKVLSQKIKHYKKLQDIFEKKELKRLYEKKGKEFWSEITKDNLSLHITNFFSIFPEVKKLSLDIFKSFPYGCQSYIVLSFKNKVSAYHHHADPMDLFALQLSGSKKWHIPCDENKNVLIRRGESLPYEPQSKEQNYIEKTLSPGDSLFVPFEVPHNVEFLGDDVSVHLVIGFTRLYKLQIDNFIKDFIDKEIFSKEDIFMTIEKDQVNEYIQNKLKNILEISSSDISQEFIKKADHYDIRRSLKG